jgi:hypothetical protein
MEIWQRGAVHPRLVAVKTCGMKMRKPMLKPLFSSLPPHQDGQKLVWEHKASPSLAVALALPSHAAQPALKTSQHEAMQKTPEGTCFKMDEK